MGTGMHMYSKYPCPLPRPALTRTPGPSLVFIHAPVNSRRAGSTKQTGRGALASTENAVVAGPEAQGQLIHYWDQANTKQAVCMSSRPSYSAEEYFKLYLAPAHV